MKFKMTVTLTEIDDGGSKEIQKMKVTRDEIVISLCRILILFLFLFPFF